MLRSFAVAPEIMRLSREVTGLQKVFDMDVEDTRQAIPDENEQYCKDQFATFGLDSEGKPVTGPPTAEQAAARTDMRATAVELTAAQEAMAALRGIVVGHKIEHDEYGKGGVEVPVTFDPKGQPSGTRISGEGVRPWADVKKSYDELDALIQAYLIAEPSLAPLVKGDKEDTAKTRVAGTGSEQDSLSTVGQGLKDTIANIAKTRPMLRTLAPDLSPIHAQLMAGTVSIGGRNWGSDPFYQMLGKDLAEQRKPGPWWTQIGLAVAEMGLYVIAGLATGGAALAVGLAVKGAVDTAVAAGKAEALEAAYRSGVTPGTDLVHEGQVHAAKVELIMTAAFALLDGAGAVGGVRSVLRTVYQYEKVAAEAAKRASEAAEKSLAKEAAKGTFDELATQARKAADEGKKAADDSATAASKAEAGETARAQSAAQKARQHAENAERRAVLLAAEREGTAVHAPPREVGAHKVKVRANRLVRCSDPCEELAASVAERAAKSVVNAEGAGLAVAHVQDLTARLRSSQGRASALSQQRSASSPC